MEFESTSELTIGLIKCFDDLLDALDNLKNHMLITDQELPGWFNLCSKYNLNISHGANPRTQGFALISQILFLEEQHPKETVIGEGIFAASQSTLDSIAQVNIAKNNFKTAMLKLKQYKIPVDNPLLKESIEDKLNKRSQNSSETLRRIGLARLCIKQCYRNIPILDHKPQSISWTWSHTNAINKITVAEAIAKLEKFPNNISKDINISKLNNMASSDYLAIVQNLAPHLRVNVLYADTDLPKRRVMLKGSLPLFYLHDPNHPFPNIKSAGAKKDKDHERSRRSDQKIESEAYIPLLRAHRYIV